MADARHLRRAELRGNLRGQALRAFLTRWGSCDTLLAKSKEALYTQAVELCRGGRGDSRDRVCVRGGGAVVPVEASSGGVGRMRRIQGSVPSNSWIAREFDYEKLEYRWRKIE